MKRFAPLLLAALCGTAAAQMQLRDGELILTSNNANYDVYALDWKTGIRRTLESGGNYADVAIAPDNLYAYGIGSGRVVRISTFGSTSTLATLPSSTVHGTAVDQDGSLMIAGYSNNRLLRLRGTSITTLSTISRPLGLCRDRQTGDFVVSQWDTSFGSLLRVNRRTGSSSTFAAGAYLSSAYDIVHLPTNGNFVVGRDTASYGLVWITNQGATVTSVNVPNVISMAFDEKHNRIFAGTRTGDIYEVSPSGTIVSKRSFAGFRWTGIGIWGSRNVAPGTTGQRGIEAYVALRFEESKSRSFCAALALGQSPGIRVGGRWQHIRADALFFATVCGRLPIFTRNFTGTLSGAGTASIYFTLPASAAAVGIPLYVTASGINPAFPGNLDLGNVAVVKVEP